MKLSDDHKIEGKTFNINKALKRPKKMTAEAFQKFVDSGDANVTLTFENPKDLSKPIRVKYKIIGKGEAVT